MSLLRQHDQAQLGPGLLDGLDPDGPSVACRNGVVQADIVSTWSRVKVTSTRGESQEDMSKDQTPGDQVSRDVWNQTANSGSGVAQCNRRAACCKGRDVGSYGFLRCAKRTLFQRPPILLP